VRGSACGSRGDAGDATLGRFAAAEEAIALDFDERGTSILIWPSRFVACERLELQRALLISTRDGRFLVREWAPWA